MTTISATICDKLIHEGISHIFVYAGGWVEHLINEAATRQGLTPILACIEGGAVAMADGFSRTSGKFGVAAVTAGPGLTNTITNMMTAYGDNVPILLISGDIAEKRAGENYIQDTTDKSLFPYNQLMQAVTTMTRNIYKEENVHSNLHVLIKNLSLGKPVHMKVCIDTLRYVIAPSPSLQVSSFCNYYLPQAHCDKTLDQILSLLEKYPRSVIFAGDGCQKEEKTTQALISFAESLNIPVMTTMWQKGIFPEDHRLSLGIFGWSSTNWADLIMYGSEPVECMLCLGNQLVALDTHCQDVAFENLKALIQIDTDVKNIGLVFPANTIPSIGTCHSFLEQMNNKIQTRKIDDSCCAALAGVKINEDKDPNIYVFVDSTLQKRSEWYEKICTNNPRLHDYNLIFEPS